MINSNLTINIKSHVTIVLHNMIRTITEIQVLLSLPHIGSLAYVNTFQYQKKKKKFIQ